MEVKDLEQMAKAAGITVDTLRNAKAILKKEKKIMIKPTGFGKDKKWKLYNPYTVPETDHK